MVEVKVQYPYVDADGTARENLVKYYAEDESGNPFMIRQVETGIEYGEAVDLFPSKYTYEATETPIDVVIGEDDYTE